MSLTQCSKSFLSLPLTPPKEERQMEVMETLFAFFSSDYGTRWSYKHQMKKTEISPKFTEETCSCDADAQETLRTDLTHK